MRVAMRLTKIQMQVLSALQVHGTLTGGQLLEKDTSLIKGTVHTTLRRMAQEGLVQGEQERRGTVAGHPRVFYSLTKEGVQALKAAQIAEALVSGRVVTIDGVRQ